MSGNANRIVILHLTSVFGGGGAGQYTMSIHRNMISEGYLSYVCVNGEELVCPSGAIRQMPRGKTTWRIRLKRSLLKIIIRCTGGVDTKYAPYNIFERLNLHNPNDLLNMMPETPTHIMVHWVSGFVNAKYVHLLQQKTGAKVYYWMIDEAILSGACHYPWDCEQYQTGCKNCPMTSSRLVKKAIRKNFIFKQKYLVTDKRVVLPTEFDKIRLEKSLLWKGCEWHKMIEIIDEDIFHPVQDEQKLRAKFNIPESKRVVFFGCSSLNEPRKGMQVLTEALNMIQRDDCVFIVAGKSDLPDLKHDVIKLGYVDIPTLSEAYQVADVFVCSSLEDSGPMMVNQAIMCGTPVVSFEIGVSLDIVHTGKTGYRAKFNDAKDLANGINYILDMPQKEYDSMCMSCRKLALNRYSKPLQSKFVKDLLDIQQ